MSRNILQVAGSRLLQDLDMTWGTVRCTDLMKVTGRVTSALTGLVQNWMPAYYIPIQCPVLMDPMDRLMQPFKILLL